MLVIDLDHPWSKSTRIARQLFSRDCPRRLVIGRKLPRHHLSDDSTHAERFFSIPSGCLKNRVLSRTTRLAFGFHGSQREKLNRPKCKNDKPMILLCLWGVQHCCIRCVPLFGVWGEPPIEQNDQSSEKIISL